MEVHQLRYFVAVAEEGSFSRAAERSHVTQPSLSQQIQKLEAEIGHPLFDRMARKVTLTEAGAGLLPIARRILNEIANAQRFAADNRGKPAGAVRLGIIPTMAPYVIEDFLRACRAKLPHVDPMVTEDVTENLVREVENGDIDLAIMSTCRPASALHIEQCRDEPLLLAVPKTHPLARAKEAAWTALRKERLLVLHESHCLSRQIRRWCAERHLRPHGEANILQLRTLLVLIATGHGVSFVPEMALSKESSNGCAFVRIRGQAPAREINLLRNQARHQSRAAAAVAGVARQVLCGGN